MSFLFLSFFFRLFGDTTLSDVFFIVKNVEFHQTSANGIFQVTPRQYQLKHSSKSMD